MAHDVDPAAIPVGYTARGEPRLYALPLAPADLCAPGGAWSVLRPPTVDHPQVAGSFESVVFPTPDIGCVRATDGLLLKTIRGGHAWSFVRHDLPAPGAALAFPTPSVGYLGVRRVRLEW